MILVYLRRIEWFVALALVQVLVLNNVHIAGYATPFIYIYLIMKISSGVSRNELVLWGFFLGLVVDIFSNTPGMNAAATTLMAFLRPYILRLFSPRDDSEEIVPAISSMGISSFIKYVIIFVLFHHTVLFLIESFSFFDLTSLLIKIASSTLLTVLCVMCLEGIKK